MLFAPGIFPVDTVTFCGVLPRDVVTLPSTLFGAGVRLAVSDVSPVTGFWMGLSERVK